MNFDIILTIFFIIFCSFLILKNKIFIYAFIKTLYKNYNIISNLQKSLANEKQRTKEEKKLAKILVPRKEVNCRGANFTLSSENWITNYRWESFDAKEPETLDWIDNEIKEGDIFFDIGSNVGVYSIYAAKKYSNIKVISIECEYSNLHLLKENIIHNSLGEVIIPYSIGLGDKEEISYLNIQDFTPGSAMHSVSTKKIEKTFEDQKVIWREGIAKISIDFFCKSTGIKPNCMKIDVDGGENNIFIGAEETFKKEYLRTLLIEISRDSINYKECENFLVHSGFYLSSEVEERSNQVWIRR
ncbi:MAG: hypothetical protein CMG75_07630 [Candidatus Marinimicrobia bacterium]|nr:hypothetical protein [Candidatus Neomarinimicrobiota bacterium]|tara:strand:+ start:15640 stop:16539 length:900 start_codon:yes stop_codon:yes gene_type:complete